MLTSTLAGTNENHRHAFSMGIHVSNAIAVSLSLLLKHPSHPPWLKQLIRGVDAAVDLGINTANLWLKRSAASHAPTMD